MQDGHQDGGDRLHVDDRRYDEAREHLAGKLETHRQRAAQCRRNEGTARDDDRRREKSEPRREDEGLDEERRHDDHEQNNTSSTDVLVDNDWKPSGQVKTIIALQCFIVFAVSLDMTFLVATLPNVGIAIQATATQTYWIATSYLLASAAVQPTVASLADIWGRRPLYWSSVLIFTVGTIVCCTANTVAAMIPGRVVQGIGGGGVLSVNLIILSDIIPVRHRSRYQGYVHLVFSLGFTIGPIIGGALVDSGATWRWLFYINFPFCAIGLGAIPFMLNYEEDNTSTREKLFQIDWIGSFLIVASVAAFLMGITWGGGRYEWSEVGTILPVVLGAVGIACTVFYERYLTSKPFLRLSLFPDMASTLIYVCTMLQSTVMFAEAYFLTLYLLAVKLLKPTIAGTILLAFLITIIPISGIVGAVMTRVGRYRGIIWSGWALTAIGAGMLILLDRKTSILGIVFLLVFAGIGQGLLFIPQSVASQASCEENDVPFATSTFSFFRSLGCCLGTAIGGTVFQNFLKQRVRELGLDSSISKNAEAIVFYLSVIPDDDVNRDIVIDAYSWALQRLFAIVAGVAGLGLLLSLAIKEFDLCKEYNPKPRIRNEKERELDNWCPA